MGYCAWALQQFRHARELDRRGHSASTGRHPGGALGRDSGRSDRAAVKKQSPDVRKRLPAQFINPTGNVFARGEVRRRSLLT